MTHRYNHRDQERFPRNSVWLLVIAACLCILGFCYHPMRR